jgi:hypothetical protein
MKTRATRRSRDLATTEEVTGYSYDLVVDPSSAGVALKKSQALGPKVTRYARYLAIEARIGRLSRDMSVGHGAD